MKGLLKAAFLLLFVAPVLLLIIQAGAPGWRYPELFPRLSGDGLRFILQQAKPIGTSLLYSLGISLGTVATTMLMSLAPAQLLAQGQFAGKRLLEGMLLMPALVPSMSFTMGLHFVFIKTGLADTLPGVVLVLAMISYPYMLRALITGYTLMGSQYRICARNLGASAWTTFRHVELPHLVPAMAAGGSVVFLVAFSEYFLVFLIGGGTVPSFTGYLFPIITSSNRGQGALLTLIFTAVPLILFAILELILKTYYRRRRME